MDRRQSASRATIIIGIVVVLTTLCSCGDSLEKQVARMQGMHINMDFKNAYARFDGVDSVYTSDAGAKLVVFVDSLSCSSCFLNHLHSYSEVNDTLRNHGGSMIVILHPQILRIEEVKSKLSLERYPFWCILDKSGEFIRNNPNLPDNKLLHTFTLDKDDNIVLVGDPMRNSKIMELLQKTLTVNPFSNEMAL